MKLLIWCYFPSHCRGTRTPSKEIISSPWQPWACPPTHPMICYPALSPCRAFTSTPADWLTSPWPVMAFKDSCRCLVIIQEANVNSARTPPTSSSLSISKGKLLAKTGNVVGRCWEFAGKCILLSSVKTFLRPCSFICFFAGSFSPTILRSTLRVPDPKQPEREEKRRRDVERVNLAKWQAEADGAGVSLHGAQRGIRIFDDRLFTDYFFGRRPGPSASPSLLQSDCHSS